MEDERLEQIPGQLAFPEIDRASRGKARADGADTMRAAAAAITPNTGTYRRRVFDRLRELGWAGATDEELQTDLRMSASTQRPRRVELVEAGLVIDSGRRRRTRSGRAAIVWIVTEMGASL